MALYVHLTLIENIASIRRNGIRMTNIREGSGVFALPVLPHFYFSHQWMRELKRDPRGSGFIVGVYFRIPDHEWVYFGHYNCPLDKKIKISASEAAGILMESEISLGTEFRGVEVIIPRKISPNELHKIRRLPQKIGWRYFPNSHDKYPCPWPCCNPRQYGAKQIRNKYGEAPYEADSIDTIRQRIVNTSDIDELAACLWELRSKRKKLKISPDFLAKIINMADPDLIESLASVITRFQHPGTRKMLFMLLEHPNETVKRAAVKSFFSLYREETFELLKTFRTDPVIAQALAAVSQTDH